MSFRDQVEARLRAFKIDAGVLDTVQRRAPRVRRGAGPALKAHYDSICREPAYRAFADKHREVLEAAGARHYTALFENGFDEAYLEASPSSRRSSRPAAWAPAPASPWR